MTKRITHNGSGHCNRPVWPCKTHGLTITQQGNLLRVASLAGRGDVAVVGLNITHRGAAPLLARELLREGFGRCIYLTDLGNKLARNLNGERHHGE